MGTNNLPRARAAVIDPRVLASSYRVIAELLLNPDQRDLTLVDREQEGLARAPAGVKQKIMDFLLAPSAGDPAEYTQLLELAPPVPLYLGTYMYDEPSSCRGAGISGRNAYMIEVAAVYGHFGFALHAELADFLPAMVEFLAISAFRPERDKIGLRRRFVETYMLPALPELRKALAKYQSPYELIIEALQAIVEADAIAMFDGPLWVPPPASAPSPTARQAPGTSAPQNTEAVS